MSVRMQSSMTSAQYINERVIDVPLRILNRGPEYLRSRMMNRDSALFHHNRRSAVELLAESKPQYIKSPTTSPENKEHAKSRLCAGVGGEDFDGTHGGNYVATEGNHLPVDQPTTTYWDHSNAGVSLALQTVTALSTGRESRQSQTDRIKTQCHKGESFISTKTGTSEGRLSVSQNKTSNTGNISCLQHANRQLIAGGEDVGQSHVSSGYSGQAKPVVPPKPSVAIKPPVPAKPSRCMTGAIRPSTLSSHADDHVTNKTSPVFTQQKHQKRPRYNGTVTAMAMDITCSHSNSHSDLKHNLPAISMEEWQDSRTDTSSERDRQSSQSSVQESATVVRRRHRKAISRSRSDLTKRFSNSSDFSELSAKFHRNSAELEKFFNEMGLDQNILEPMKLGQSAHAQSSSSLNLFESVSCMGSTDARSYLSDESHPSDGHRRHHDAGERTPGGSAVERNARIIKWLCGIKVASTSHSSQQTVQHQKSAD